MFKFTTKGLTLLLSALMFFPLHGLARQGLWLPPQLKKQQDSLKKAGLKIPVGKLFSNTDSGLNNAVVLFGNGCTASFVSDSGLILTNHHCGYGYAQRLSTPEHNFLTDGFWAKNRSQEIPCPGLTVTITHKMFNATSYILKNLPDSLSPEDRQAIIQKRIKDIEASYAYFNKGMDATVKAFYDGNQYWVVLSQTYRDVRLVAFPPNSIGSFGGNFDNWMWPREAGDFSVFRVYANAQNEPAPYSPDNVPYQPEQYFKISTAGYHQGSFAMVYGYPYRTQEYLTSSELAAVKDILYPIRIALREKRLSIWDSAMSVNSSIFLKYAAKEAGLSNGYKKWRGALQGLTKHDVIAQKKVYELRFNNMAAQLKTDSSVQLLLPKIAAAVNGSRPALKAEEYLREGVFGVEIVREAQLLNAIVRTYRTQTDSMGILARLGVFKILANNFYKNYVPGLDKKVFESVMPIYMAQNDNIVAPGLRTLLREANNNYELWAGSVFSNSLLDHPQNLDSLLSRINPADTFIIKEDPAYRIYAAAIDFQKSTIKPEMESFEKTIKPLKREYMKWMMTMSPSNTPLYPDANQTLRLSYGKVQPLKLANSNIWQTTLADLVARNNPSSKDFAVPDSLMQLFLRKDYGRWAQKDSTMAVNFLTTAQTTGGNSGSPVLNAQGQLIGLNFDRPWQGTMSDFYFSDKDCRNISVDIRYVMFLIQKYGHADWLLKEMDFVK